ncbi:hypothetical protein [Stieleria neptunia]|uniref:hypothetical protein n=1 Tax=Stieleria neptunia TaxID=2527979 RepID=UPI0011A15739|nr:hypothetical protein [Stieleria neptunia]
MNLNPYEAVLPISEASRRFSVLSPFRPDIACTRWFVGVFGLHTTFLVVHAVVQRDYTFSVEPIYWLAVAAGVYFRVRFFRYGILIVSPLYMAAAILIPVLWVFGRFNVSWRIGATDYPTPSPWFVALFGVTLFCTFAYPFVVMFPKHVNVLFQLPRKASEPSDAPMDRASRFDNRNSSLGPW